MASTRAQSVNAVLEPTAAALRKQFRASARALMVNRPLREVATAATEPAALLSKAELEAIEQVGLSINPWTGDVAEDPLTKTIVDYMALIETSLSTAQAAAMLGVDVSRIRQRLRERSLFGLEYEGEWRLPRFQFERKKALPNLAVVLAALQAELNPLDVATWFLEPNIDLDANDDGTPVSPRAWLLKGASPSTVAQLARQL
ncbi:MAG: hypothetical protein ABWY07_01120 [Burkholderiales bacterium]